MPNLACTGNFLISLILAGCDEITGDSPEPLNSPTSATMSHNDESADLLLHQQEIVSTRSSQPDSDSDTASRQAKLRDVVHPAFLTSHEGWSTDEVLLDDQRNHRFLKHCQQQAPEAEPFQCNWTLLNLRKSGAL